MHRVWMAVEGGCGHRWFRWCTSAFLTHPRVFADLSSRVVDYIVHVAGRREWADGAGTCVECPLIAFSPVTGAVESLARRMMALALSSRASIPNREGEAPQHGVKEDVTEERKRRPCACALPSV